MVYQTGPLSVFQFFRYRHHKHRLAHLLLQANLQAASAEAQQVLSHVGVPAPPTVAFGRAPLMNPGRAPQGPRGHTAPGGDGWKLTPRPRQGSVRWTRRSAQLCRIPMMFLGLVILVRNTLRIRNRTLRNFRNDQNMLESSYKEMARGVHHIQ